MNYLTILLALFLSAALVEWKYHFHLYRTRKERLIVMAFFFVIGVIWDTYAIQSGHWNFPEGKNLGIKIGVMPIEEYLFILIIPFWIITIYKLADQKLKLR
jgi:lycopene cyclase domain-containing protein